MRNDNYVKRQNKYAYLFCSFLIISILLIGRDVLDFNFSKYILLGLCSIMLIFSPTKNHFFAIILFLLPLYGGLPNNYITFVIIIVLLLKYKYRFNKECFLGVCLFIAYELLHCIYPPFSIYDFVIDAVYVCLFFMVIFDITDKKMDKAMLASSMALGTIVACSIILLVTLKTHSFSNIITESIRLGANFERTEGVLFVALNPNSIALYCVISIGFLFCSRKNNIWIIVLSIILFIYGALTISRNFILSTIVLFLLFLLFSELKRKIWYIIIPIVLLVIINEISPAILENILNRFQVDDITNGRGEITLEYFRSWLERVDAMLFGFGIQDYQIKYNVSESIHNATMEILLVWGIIGFVAFFSLVVTAISKNMKNMIISKYGLCVLITFILSIQFSRIITTPETLLILGFCLIFLFDKKHGQAETSKSSLKRKNG